MKLYNSINAQAGDSESTLLEKISQALGASVKWGQPLKETLAQILTQLNALAGNPELSGETSPVDDPPYPNKAATYHDTANNFTYRWNVHSHIWVPEPKVYEVVFTSGDGTIPTVDNVLANTLGNVVWAYTAPGYYTLTLAGAFSEDRTAFYSTVPATGGTINISWVSENVIDIYTTDSSGSNADEVAWKSPLRIEVYPVIALP